MAKLPDSLKDMTKKEKPMEPKIRFEKSIERYWYACITFEFEYCKCPQLRKRLEALGYPQHPYDDHKEMISPYIILMAQTNHAVRKTFTIRRNYELIRDDEETIARANAHVNEYARKVAEDLKEIS